MSEALRIETSSRVVVVGDLNGHARLLDQLLFGMELMDEAGVWQGGSSVLVQMGDLINRGAGSRAAMDRLLQLQQQAEEAGGAVHWILGNHEAMTALQNEAYVTADEFLEFATEEETAHFIEARTEYIYDLLGPADRPQRINPIGGRLKAWEEENVPGQEAFRSSFGPGGIYGRAIRSLPPAIQINENLFVHGGLTPAWAELGLEGLRHAVAEVWDSEPAAYQSLDPSNILRDPDGPLWHRAYCTEEGSEELDRDVASILDRFDAKRMLVGHTRTESVGGVNGQPELRRRGRLLMTDVGIGEPGEPGSVVVFEAGRASWWSPIWGDQAFVGFEGVL